MAAGAACGCGRTVTISIQEAKTRHEARLLALPGVVSVGIGLDAAQRPVLVVGVREHAAEALEQIPGELDGHPVVVRAAGTVRAQ